MVNPLFLRFAVRQFVWLSTRLVGVGLTKKILQSDIKMPKTVSVVTSIAVAVGSFVSLDYLNYKGEKFHERLEKEKAYNQVLVDQLKKSGLPIPERDG